MTNIMTAADVAALTEGALEASLGAVANPTRAPVAVIIDECAAMDHAQDGTDQNLAAHLIERDDPKLRAMVNEEPTT